MSTAQEEHNRLFHRSTRKRPPTLSHIGRSRLKRQRTPSWSHRFVCLSSNEASKWVSQDRYYLERAGLGERQINFENVDNCSSAEFADRLREEYPKLAEGGGLELLRLIPNSRVLQLIESPRDGYTPLFLSRVVGSALVFIRPISRSLSLSPPTSEVSTYTNYQYSTILYCP